MPHWDTRTEENWKKFKFNQPFAKGLKTLRENVLSNPDFDPAVLWQWGTMQAMAVIQILKDCEKKYGREGQKLVNEALHKVGYNIGRQALENIELDPDISEEEFISFYGTAMNCIAYASLEEPRIESGDRVAFDILWCPHQDEYKPFDCRVQRYLVQGMIDAARDTVAKHNWQMKFTCIITAGADKCRFEIWKATEEEVEEWRKYTESLEQKALEMSKREG